VQQDFHDIFGPLNTSLGNTKKITPELGQSLCLSISFYLLKDNSSISNELLVQVPEIQNRWRS